MSTSPPRWFSPARNSPTTATARLAADIVTGTLRWQRSLDHLIEHFAARAVAKLDADVLVILRLSLYQLLHLDRVPASAVVDDAVDLTRGARKQSATGFVNGVLRSTLRNRHRLPLPARPDEPGDRAAALAYLGITHSHPDWLVARWLNRYGFDDAERWVRFNNEAPALTLRANTLRVTREQLAAALAAKGSRRNRRATRRTGSSSAPAIRCDCSDGTIEGCSSSRTKRRSWSPLVADVRPGERVLDLCASPGGKTTAMAADMPAATESWWRRDVRPRRMRLLTETVRASARTTFASCRYRRRERCRSRRCSIASWLMRPARALAPSAAIPTSAGAGPKTDLAQLRSRQVELLGRAADVLAPQGRLVYATCSSEPEENEAVDRAVPDRSTRPSTVSTCARPHRCSTRSSTTAACCERCRSPTASRRSSPPPWYDTDVNAPRHSRLGSRQIPGPRRRARPDIPHLFRPCHARGAARA